MCGAVASFKKLLPRISFSKTSLKKQAAMFYEHAAMLFVKVYRF